MQGGMLRLARLDAPGILYHVIIRGIERKNIFRDTTDKQNLVDRLDQLIPQTQTSCYAWVLLSNHAHFLLRSGPDGLVSLMQRLLTGYAVSFNPAFSGTIAAMGSCFKTGKNYLFDKYAYIMHINAYENNTQHR
jgi:REP element-mobilizing transposase RayT